MNSQLTLQDGLTIRLRPPTEADIPSIYEAALSSREQLRPWMVWCHDDYQISDTAKWIGEAIADENIHTFAIFDDAESICLGTCGLNDLNVRHRKANLGYWVRGSHRQRGIASAATLAVAGYAFSELDLMRVEIVVALGNLASQRVARRVGATREGVLRSGLMLGEKPIDSILYSLVPADLQK